MSNVEFESDDSQQYKPVQRASYADTGMNAGIRGSVLSRLFIKIGFAKDEASAQKAMIIITVLAFLITAFFVYKLLFENKAYIPAVMPPFVHT